MGPLVINLENLSKLRPKMPETVKNEDFRFFVNPLMPVPPVTNLGLSSSSDVITFDQNSHHLYSTSEGGRHFFNDAQIRVIC